MVEDLRNQGANARERIGTNIHIINKPPVRPLDLLSGAEAMLTGELYKQTKKSIKSDDPVAIKQAFYTSLTEKSHRFDPSLLRWQTLRQNPEGAANNNIRLTGFEGYYAGSNLTPDEIIRDITNQGSDILKTLPRGLKNDVHQILSGGVSTFPGIIWLNEQFGAVLGKYRAYRSQNHEAQQFRDSLSLLPISKISYLNDGALQDFTVPVLGGFDVLKAFNPTINKDTENPYTFMQQIGRLGHPLFRTVLESIDPNEFAHVRYKPVTW